MSLRPKYREDWFFLGIVVVFAVLGVLGGLYMPWYSILGLSAIFIVVWMFTLLCMNPHGNGFFVIVFLTGMPVMLFLSWITFFLSFGIRG